MVLADEVCLTKVSHGDCSQVFLLDGGTQRYWASYVTEFAVDEFFFFFKQKTAYEM